MPYKNIFVYNIASKTLIDAKPLPIRFNKIDGLIRVFDGTRYLVLFGTEKFDFIWNRFRYLIGIKSCITYVISHNYAKNQIRFIRFFTSRKKKRLFIIL